MSTTEDLAADIRSVDGDHKLGAGELAEALGALGWTKAPVAPEHPPLRSYKVGQLVSAVRNGEWLEGVISEIDPFGTHVQTDRGPVTIAKDALIKPRA